MTFSSYNINEIEKVTPPKLTSSELLLRLSMKKLWKLQLPNGYNLTHGISSRSLPSRITRLCDQDQYEVS